MIYHYQYSQRQELASWDDGWEGLDPAVFGPPLVGFCYEISPAAECNPYVHPEGRRLAQLLEAVRGYEPAVFP